MRSPLRRASGKKGVLVTFEGIEGSGKSTLIRRLARDLRKRGLPVLVTREPGGTPMGRRIRALFLDPASRGMTPLTELALIAADRAQHVAEVLGPALAKGGIVLCDRFSDATFAYQGHGRGLSQVTVAAFDGAARGGIEPDLTVIIDLPPEIALERVRTRNRGTTSRETRLDDEKLGFHRRVREGYLARSSEALLLDGMEKPSVLAGRVLKALEKRLPRGV